ncbi:MAG: hypothetical protein WCW25_03385 [Patescibacteria group bacterium]|jgi:hypothetical protein
MNIKKILFQLLIAGAGVFILGAVIYLGIGVNDYLKWVKVKAAVAEGAFPWQCGAFQILGGMAGCTETQYGCTCKLCEALCNESTFVQFVGQPGCGGMNYACISPEVMPSGMPILMSSQAILAGTSNMISANGVVGTQSLAAHRVEKILDYFKVIIAGKKESKK